MPRLRVAFILGAAFLAFAFSVVIGQESQKKSQPKPASEVFNEFGRVVRLDLNSAPFPDAARQAGYSYEGEFFPRVGHYDDSSVAVFIPKHFKPRGKVDLVFFFHGWYSSISEAAQDFDLFRQFSASGEKALLVMPETARDAPDSFAGKLERENSFRALETELLDALGAAGVAPDLQPGRITLMGHSGAYHVISCILAQKGIASKVTEVCLFDALYEDVDEYAAWIKDDGGRFVSICAEDGDPADNSRSLAALLRDDGIDFQTGNDDPREDARILGKRVVLLSSPYEHGALINQADEFRRVLAAERSSN